MVEGERCFEDELGFIMTRMIVTDAVVYTTVMIVWYTVITRFMGGEPFHLTPVRRARAIPNASSINSYYSQTYDSSDGIPMMLRCTNGEQAFVKSTTTCVPHKRW